MEQEDARIIALRALGWLAAEDELFLTFLGASGARAEDVRAQAQDPGLLLSVLDFIFQRDDWVMACAAAGGIGPERLGLAHAVLGGRDRMHWT